MLAFLLAQHRMRRSQMTIPVPARNDERLDAQSGLVFDAR